MRSTSKLPRLSVFASMKQALGVAPLSARDSSMYQLKVDGSERYVVAGSGSLSRGDVLFDRVTGTVLDKPVRHSVQVEEGIHLDCDSDMRFINHSCDPNCRMEVFPSANGNEEPHVRVSVIANTIQPGDVVSVDYNTFELNMGSPFDCMCGAALCRGRIAGFARLPVAIREEYLQQNGDLKRPNLLTRLVRSWGEANRDAPPIK